MFLMSVTGKVDEKTTKTYMQTRRLLKKSNSYILKLKIK